MRRRDLAGPTGWPLALALAAGVLLAGIALIPFYAVFYLEPGHLRP